MSKGILIQTSLKFSAKIIKLQQYLIKQKKETIKKMLVSSLNTAKSNMK